MAAYEQIWRAEESELWSWLEERVGMEGLAYPGSGAREEEKGRGRRDVGMKGIRARLAEERMAEREVDEAIRVTEERLRVLKGIVGRKKEEAKKRAGEGAEVTKGEEHTDESSWGEDEGYVFGGGNKGKAMSDEL